MDELIGWHGRERAQWFSETGEPALRVVELKDGTFACVGNPLADGDRLLYGKRGEMLLSEAEREGLIAKGEVHRG